MAASILVRRGLQANLAGASLTTGELAFTTDTGKVYVFDGSNKVLIGHVEQDTFANRPAFGVSGRMFYATDTGDTYLDTGSAWVVVGVNDLASLSGDLDDISDGSSYQRVAATEVDASGFVTQINDGSNVVTASTANTHITDDAKHREINDSATTTTNLWSGSKIQNALDNAISGLTWRDPVDEVATAPTGNESGNDGWRVLINGTGTGAFAGHDNAIATWDDVGSSWSFTAPSANWAVLDKATEAGYTYDADTTAWVQFTGAGQITAGIGLSKTGNTLNVNLGAGIKELPSDEVGLDLAAGSGLSIGGGATADQLTIVADSTTGATVAPVALGANGVGVAVDNATIAHSSGTLAIKDGGVDADALAATVAGNGLTGGAGSNLAVGAGNGITVNTNDVTVNPDSTTGATVAPLAVSANGAGVTVDNSSIKHSGGSLYVDVVDGGTF